ncbi:hypothetical protein DPMN_137270 [Dreissena polymorpha]|uniref:Uncharacterized protein n=1 Tax=Dreissena polymorpha TaxID=45954 RepID=A0A9D4JEK1_DREPO|nr:hypothetical protein DPMN_137270 [Dreissena polymorpha]
MTSVQSLSNVIWRRRIRQNVNLLRHLCVNDVIWTIGDALDKLGKPRPVDNRQSGRYSTSYAGAIYFKTYTFDDIRNVNDVFGRIGNAGDMLGTPSQISVPIFITFGQILCLQPRENLFHYKVWGR